MVKRTTKETVAKKTPGKRGRRPKAASSPSSPTKSPKTPTRVSKRIKAEPKVVFHPVEDPPRRRGKPAIQKKVSFVEPEVKEKSLLGSIGDFISGIFGL
ncbi:hypothetical protein HDV06_003446 [Boothiomyces sp. JEL0866]|nr:hypothetical protein HDV06_003446 [Boothiomyces sp. JEL0866]